MPKAKRPASTNAARSRIGRFGVRAGTVSWCHGQRVVAAPASGLSMADPAGMRRQDRRMAADHASENLVEVAQAEIDPTEEMAPELLDRLPDNIVEDLRDGTIDKIPESIVEELPPGLADQVPDDLIASATSNPLIAIALVSVGVFSVLGAVWGVVKGLIKLAVVLAIVAAVAWFWFFAR